MSRRLLVTTTLVALAAVRALAQAPAGDVLKRPIAEAGLDALVPRAVAVAPGEPAAPIPKAKGATEITALEATFDNRKHEAIFVRDVTVTDPEFSLTCERLVAMLKHKADPDPAAPKERSPAAAPKAPGKEKGGLQRAIAEGNVVIKQTKTEADGSTSQSFGRAQRADYNALTGDIILTGNPFVQQGFNQCIATAPETVMTLNRDRHMKVVGPHRTIISDKVDTEK